MEPPQPPSDFPKPISLFPFSCSKTPVEKRAQQRGTATSWSWPQLSCIFTGLRLSPCNLGIR